MENSRHLVFGFLNFRGGTLSTGKNPLHRSGIHFLLAWVIKECKKKWLDIQ
jgi:hypothetical protein